VSSSGNPTVNLNGVQVGMVGVASTTTTATIEAIVSDSGSASTISILKGYDGQTTVQLVRDDASAVPIATLVDSSTTGDYSASLSVPASSVIGEGLPDEHVDPRRLSLAFYYPWFNEGTFDQGFWWAKPTGPYATDEASSVQSMVSQAAGAGINGFVVSWDGQHNSEFSLVQEAADATPGFSFLPYIELSIIVSRMGDNPAQLASYIAGAFASDSDPAFLHIGSQPVAFLYGSSSVTPAVWQQVYADLQADGVDPFIVGDAPPAAGYGFDGFHLYDPNGFSQGTLEGMYASAEDATHLEHMINPAAPALLWVATASPGENNIFDGGHTVQSRSDGRYSMTWSTAIGSNPDWVVITSWNEWYEATNIQPDTVNGSAALAATKTWSATFAG
jgi:hypothetical protein